MSKYIRPVQGGWISASFDAHRNRKPPSVNPGTDYAVVVGTKVVAVADGTVSRVTNTYAGSGGRVLTIDHGGGNVTQSLHLDKIHVVKGQKVKQGQHVADSGSSANGKSRGGVGPHLHLSFIRNGKNLDFEALRKETSMPVTTVNGFSVKEIQEHLARHGFPTKIDGVWGPATAAQVKAFQQAKGLVADGIAGKATWAELIKPVATPTPPVPTPTPTPVSIDYDRIKAMIPTAEQIATAVRNAIIRD